MARFILDTRLSDAHFVLCQEAIARGVIEPSDLNEGRRTMAEQWAFWNAHKRDPINEPLAAFPSPFAPHILRGKENHAIDAQDNRVHALADFYREMGVPVVLNSVDGEPWHMVFPDEGALIRAAHSIKSRGGKLATLTPGQTHSDVRSLRYKLWDATGESNSKTPVKRFYGPGLVRKVKAFQRKHGMRADGVVGPKTWAALDRAAKRSRRG